MMFTLSKESLDEQVELCRIKLRDAIFYVPIQTLLLESCNVRSTPPKIHRGRESFSPKGMIPAQLPEKADWKRRSLLLCVVHVVVVIMEQNNIKQRINGALYTGVWYSSILVGFYYLYAPLLPLLLIHRSLYRKLTDILFAAWESYNVSLLEIVFGCRTFIGGDSFRPEENSLIVLNHRTRVDWNFFWSALLHGTSPPAHNAKLVLKDEVKEIPGLGKRPFHYESIAAK